MTVLGGDKMLNITNLHVKLEDEDKQILMDLSREGIPGDAALEGSVG